MATRLASGETYAPRNPFVKREEGPGPYHGFVENGRWTGRVKLIPDQLEKPRHWRKPRKIATCLMGDLFHEALTDEDIARVFAVMRSEARHTFQVPTKRPRRMREWFSRCGNGGGLGWITHNNTEPERSYQGTGIIVGNDDRWPLPNVWLGVSVEDQATADERIPLLLQTPAAVRWVSYEPCLGPVDFSGFLVPHLCVQCGHAEVAHGLWHRTVGCQAGDGTVKSPICGCRKLRGEKRHERGDPYEPHPDGVNWLVIGGESGPGARPCDVEWIRGGVRQCQAAGVACFVKQDSGPRPGKQGRIPDDLWIKEWPDARS